uniref:Uncharacterized protein n=1 Tax=viral metagenome TaxID=1070528 RepID=A0A6M3IKE3_9ZZZZ
MACPKRERDLTAALARRRETLRKIGERSPKAMGRHRLTICCSASKCGRLCPRLLKEPGVERVFCLDLATTDALPLYKALEDVDFACPEGRF